MSLPLLGWLRRRFFGPVPRKYPFGNGDYCDGCDVRLTGSGIPFNVGFYCDRCTEEVRS